MGFVRILLLAVVMIVRLLPFILIAALVIWLWRRSVRRGRDPDFQGPVINVDYKVVEDDPASAEEEPHRTQDPPSGRPS